MSRVVQELGCRVFCEREKSVLRFHYSPENNEVYYQTEEVKNGEISYLDHQKLRIDKDELAEFKVRNELSDEDSAAFKYWLRGLWAGLNERNLTKRGMDWFEEDDGEKEVDTEIKVKHLERGRNYVFEQLDAWSNRIGNNQQSSRQIASMEVAGAKEENLAAATSKEEAKIVAHLTQKEQILELIREAELSALDWLEIYAEVFGRVDSRGLAKEWKRLIEMEKKIPSHGEFVYASKRNANNCGSRKNLSADSPIVQDAKRMRDENMKVPDIAKRLGRSVPAVYRYLQIANGRHSK